MTIVPTPAIPPSTQDLINGQEEGKYDITAGDYVTYIEDQLGVGAPKADLRIIAEASFLQPNVLTLLVKGGSGDQHGQPAQEQGRLGQRAERHRHPADRLPAPRARAAAIPGALHQRAVPRRGDGTDGSGQPRQRVVRPEPFVSLDEAAKGLTELADLDQGSAQDFPIQGYVVTAAWAKKYPNTLKAFTTTLSQGQEIADTNRAAVETAIEHYLGIQPEDAAFISLPTFPLGVDPVRLQRVVNAMNRFGLLPQGTTFNINSMIIGG